ncbi:MAG: hypothetical protein CVT64_10050 [Actinobacteria bacterium HGW-Actinobacteria-4]|nr:MAG: hypothetical protein CVT64_10050 [Actinobacteria bacterium HGW-Actinobacteria-4]
MANPSEHDSEEFHKGTEDLQKLAEAVERDRAVRAAHQGEKGEDAVEKFTKTEAEAHHEDDSVLDTPEKLDDPEKRWEVPMGSVNRVTHEEGHRT